MTKQSKQQLKPDPPVPSYLKGHGGAGKSKRPTDNTYFWVPDCKSETSNKYEPELAEYINLLDKIDSTKDPRLLLPLLKVPAAVLRHFEDLFERLEFKTRKKRRADAQKSYKPTPYQIRLMLAVSQVVNRGRSVARAAAITEAAAEYKLEVDKLTLALDGHHASTQRSKVGATSRR
jgi:hypothetical protein